MENNTTAETTKSPLQDTPTAVLIEELKRRNDLKPEHIAALHSLQATQVRKPQDVPAAKSPEEQDQTLAEKFAKAVIRRNVYGKIPPRSKVNGIEINREGLLGYYDHGPNKIDHSTLEMNVLRLLTTVEKAAYEKSMFFNFLNSHIVSVVPSEIDHGNMVLTISFFQDRKQQDSRGACTLAYVSTELPNKVMQAFLGEVQKNPDLLEDFYQKAFAGLDSRDGSPGMRRLKADGFYLISEIKKLEEAGRAWKENNAEAVNIFFNSLEKYHYQHGPYGTGEAFAPTSR